MKKSIVLFNNCFIINGYSRVIIFDSLIYKYFFVPKSFLYYIKRNSIEKSILFPKIIEMEYNDFIINNRIGMFAENSVKNLLSNYSIKLNYEPFSIISNIVLYYSDNVIKNLNLFFIEKLKVEAIIIFINETEFNDDFYRFIDSISNNSITHIELVLTCKDNIKKENIENYDNFLKNQSRVNILYFIGRKIDLDKLKKYGLKKIVTIDKEKVEICSSICKDGFICNLFFFTESQHHNTCLNRKLCIDKDGYIKNCPSMKHHYGHISDTNIEEVVNLPEFQRWWHIKKDDIDVCKDCEFRHMCTDCRAYIKDPENIYSQPAKCPYNPYICKWEGEDGYVPVEECGTYTRETGFVPNKRKINKLNKQIWGE